jgi:hypothetical protein
MNELLIKIVEVDKMPKRGGAISWRTLFNLNLNPTISSRENS